MAPDKTGWSDGKAIARALLHDRAARRKIIGRMMMTALTCLVMCFAMYDALAVLREERGKRG